MHFVTFVAAPTLARSWWLCHSERVTSDSNAASRGPLIPTLLVLPVPCIYVDPIRTR